MKKFLGLFTAALIFSTSVQAQNNAKIPKELHGYWVISNCERGGFVLQITQTFMLELFEWGHEIKKPNSVEKTKSGSWMLNFNNENYEMNVNDQGELVQRAIHDDNMIINHKPCETIDRNWYAFRPENQEVLLNLDDFHQNCSTENIWYNGKTCQQSLFIFADKNKDSVLDKDELAQTYRQTLWFAGVQEPYEFTDDFFAGDALVHLGDEHKTISQDKIEKNWNKIKNIPSITYFRGAAQSLNRLFPGIPEYIEDGESDKSCAAPTANCSPPDGVIHSNSY